MRQFKIVRRGYQTQEVDQAMEELEKRLAVQEAELSAYRQREESLREAEEKAQEKARLIIEQANKAADERLHRTIQEMNRICRDAVAIRELTEIFQQEYNQLLKQYLLRIRSEEFPELMDRLGALIEKTGGEYLQNEEEQ